MKHDVRAEGDARSRARTFWDEYKWLILLTAVTFFMVLLAAKGCSEDPYRAAVADATTKCVDESGVLERAGLSRSHIRQGIDRDDTAEMYATMRTLGCLSE